MESLRNKLLIGFLAFALISVLIIVPSSNYYFDKKESISNIIHRSELIYKYMLQDFRVVTDFFRFETSNPHFFIEKKSRYLQDHHKHVEDIMGELHTLLKHEDLHYLDIQPDIKTTQDNYKEYLTTLNEIVALLLERGFKDFGNVGKMRHYIHQLEDYENIDQTQVLSLRRHEKDYIIRHQDQYITKLNNRSQSFKKQIKHNNRLNQAQKESAVAMLQNYVKSFNQLVSYDKKIGLHYNSGLKKKLDNREKKIEENLRAMIAKAVSKKDAVYARLKYYYIVFFLVLIGLIIFVSSYTSQRITQPLINLSNYISEFVKNGFYHPEKLKDSGHKDEIATLYQEFINLIEQLDKREQEKNEAKENLKENEIHFRELANMLPQCVFETDALGNFTYVNKNWVETFGYSRQDIKGGLNITEILVSESGNRSNDSFKVRQNEYVAKRKDGSTFNALVYTNRIVNDAAIVGKRGLIIDNTQRKKYLEELENAKRRAETSDKLKSSFLANMSHEIRTPVHAIMGFSGLLKDVFGNRKKQEEYIHIIQKSTEDLLHLIDDIIDVAKIEAGEIRIQKTNCNLNPLFDELELTFQTILKQREKTHLDLIMSKAVPDQELIIYTDPSRLKQIFSNLLNNAIKFTARGSIEFGYSFHTESAIQFYVKDTGIGMEQDQLEIIFERFRQADNTQTREYGGTGLGLTISKSLVELLGGNIQVYSAPGEGTVFYFAHPFEMIMNPKALVSSRKVL
jgi:PAS domain S-box-containing protein